MTMNTHVLNLSEITGLSFEKLLELILANKSMMIKNLRVFDLVMCDDKIIKTGNGIYIVHSGTKIDYVGKATSRSFVERIPAHFDSRKKLGSTHY